MELPQYFSVDFSEFHPQGDDLRSQLSWHKRYAAERVSPSSCKLNHSKSKKDLLKRVFVVL